MEGPIPPLPDSILEKLDAERERLKSNLTLMRQLLKAYEGRYREASEALRGMEEALKNSDLYYSEGKRYTSINELFNAAIKAQKAIYLCKYWSGEEDFEEILSSVEEGIEKAKSAVKELEGAYEIVPLQARIAAEFRLKDALRSLKDGVSHYDKGDVEGGLVALAYSLWRSRSAVFWSSFGDVRGGIEVSEEEVLRIAQSYVYSAETVVTYSETVLSESGTRGPSLSYLSQAEDFLSEAKSDISSDPVLAIGESIHAMAYATDAMTLGLAASEEALSSYVQYARERAIAHIYSCFNCSVIPLLSLLYLEYGDGLNEPALKSLMYRLASMYAFTVASLVRKPPLGPSEASHTSSSSPAVISKMVTSTTTVTLTSSYTHIITTTVTSGREADITKSWILLVSALLVGLFLGFLIGRRR